jgi:N-hydroxyarylamine O-acetyltransferase
MLINISSYFERIGYKGQPNPTLELLEQIHLAHLHAVPFENLDIHLDRPIRLDMERILTKIVNNRRGGFCYELNGAFAWLLNELEFDVTLLSAGVYGLHQPGPEFDHLALKIKIDGQFWLADVGFGDGFMTPLRFEQEMIQTQPNGDFRIVAVDGWLLLQRRKPGEEAWQPTYRFHDRPRNFHEFAGMCCYQQYAAESAFRQKRLVTLPTAAGRMTLSEMMLIETENGQRRETILPDEAAVQQVLQERFGINLRFSMKDFR